MNKYYIPQTLDEPFKIILWTVDELLAFAFPFLLCLMVFHKGFVGAILGVISLLFIKKQKGEQGHFYIFHLLYWNIYLPSFVFPLKKTPNACLRTWIG